MNFSSTKSFFKVYPVLLDIASDGNKNDEMRLMSLHCLRDAVDVKPELMVSNASNIVEKVLFLAFIDLIHQPKNFVKFKNLKKNLNNFKNLEKNLKK